jgi:hypothetical protein
MNVGLLGLFGGALLVGAVLLGLAARALVTGEFVGSARMVHGVPVGIASVQRQDRPLVFWACVIAYCLLGVGCFAAAMVFLP